MTIDNRLNDNDVMVEQFADIRILRYRIPGFENLSLANKKLLYCLSEAALWGRDILYDQHYRHNLLVRKVLEDVYAYQTSLGAVDADLLLYLKRIWFSNGVHHHYSTDKFKPGFTGEQLSQWIHLLPDDHPFPPSTTRRNRVFLAFFPSPGYTFILSPPGRTRFSTKPERVSNRKGKDRRVIQNFQRI